MTVIGAYWTEHNSMLTSAFQRNMSLQHVLLDLIDDDENEEESNDVDQEAANEDRNDNRDIHGIRRVEQEYVFHQRMLHFRKRNQRLWQTRDLCDDIMENNAVALWPQTMALVGRKQTRTFQGENEIGEQEDYSSLFYAISCFFA